MRTNVQETSIAAYISLSDLTARQAQVYHLNGQCPACYITDPSEPAEAAGELLIYTVTYSSVVFRAHTKWN